MGLIALLTRRGRAGRAPLIPGMSFGGIMGSLALRELPGARDIVLPGSDSVG